MMKCRHVFGSTGLQSVGVDVMVVTCMASQLVRSPGVKAAQLCVTIGFNEVGYKMLR